MKRKSGRKSGKGEEENGVDPDQENGSAPDEPVEKKKKSKGKKKHSKGDADEESIGSSGQKNEIEGNSADEEDESQYEVEAILDEKNIRGVRHFLIRWKGYTEESDTWEPESTLECPELIAEYRKKHPKGSKKKKHEKSEAKKPDWNENDDFEVGSIREVHFRRDGKREFLVSWKGYPASEDTWEPEENMDCKDLIEKFMAKVDKVKTVDRRELRVNRPTVQRLTLAMHEGAGRRLSKRNRGKERVHYLDAE